MSVQTDDTGLIGLRNVGEDHVHHADEHAVAERVAGVFDDGDNVGAVCRHGDKITTAAVREFNRVHSSRGSDDVSDVRDRRSRGGAQVEHARARSDVDVLQTTEDTSRQLRSERVPDSVFGLEGRGSFAFDRGRRVVDADTLLAVHALAGRQVLGDQQIFLAGAGNEHARVSVRFLV